MKQILFTDSFEHGFAAGVPQEGKPWSYMSMGPIAMSSDEYEIHTANGLEVIPRGRHPHTGEPAFTVTAPQQLGQVDHIKWAALANVGTHGFEAVKGKKISFEALIGGRTYGNASHPFGDAVKAPESDLRLGDSVLLVMAPEHMIVFDFFITNTKIYAIYERGRAMHEGEPYEAYSFGVPVADRQPDDMHLLRIIYAPDTNSVAWFVDDREVYRAEHVGLLIDREHMYIDNGGTAKEVTCRMFQSGLALFTLLDGSHDGKGLVNLTGSDIYFDPQQGEPARPVFVDPDSRPENRLFGQGASLCCHRFSVFYE
ncbi:MAG: hypothetical protein IJT12_03770 [Paludibacteraceae bacterium]|nr:hypothetical protein [Paludibacteraceae bacterium]